MLSLIYSNSASTHTMKNTKLLTFGALIGSALSLTAAPVVLNEDNFTAISGKASSGNTITITSDLNLADAGTSGLSTTNEYILEAITIVQPGVTLTFPAGAVVRGQPGENLVFNEDGSLASGTAAGTLLVSRGGALVANGTSTDPVIFTTAMDSNRGRYADGDTFLDANPTTAPLAPVTIGTGSSSDPQFENNSLWGAVTLLGYAPTNRGSASTGVNGEAYIEGFGGTSEPYTYGGHLPNDSSGSLSYVSIRHSGLTIVEGDEQQGLTLGGVGSGTTLEFVEIYCSGDDGIEIFGGTANLRNVVISNVDDDCFDLDQGWTGNCQFLLLLGTDNPVTNANTDSIGEWDGMDGDSGNTATMQAAIDGYDPTDAATVTALTDNISSSTTPDGTPFMAPTIYNMTAFAEGSTSHTFEMDSGYGGALFNSIIQGLPANGIDIEDETNANSLFNNYPSQSPTARIVAGSFLIANNTIVGVPGVTAASVQKDQTSGGTNSSVQIDIFAASGTYPGVDGNEFISSDGGVNPLGFGAYNAASTDYNDQDVIISPAPNAYGTGSSVLVGAANVTPVTGSFFTVANYRGAFDPTNFGTHWTTGWTALNLAGILENSATGL